MVRPKLVPRRFLESEPYMIKQSGSGASVSLCSPSFNTQVMCCVAFILFIFLFYRYWVKEKHRQERRRKRKLRKRYKAQAFTLINENQDEIRSSRGGPVYEDTAEATGNSELTKYWEAY